MEQMLTFNIGQMAQIIVSLGCFYALYNQLGAILQNQEHRLSRVEDKLEKLHETIAERANGPVRDKDQKSYGFQRPV